ncbi:unnamed protein product [Cunninghamella blakesleeana]
MGKANKFKTDPKNISKHANSTAETEPKTVRERVNKELHLLEVRKQAISVKNTPPTITSKKGGVVKSKKANAKQKKKIAKALAVADMEEQRILKQTEKKELRKIRKQDWN